MEAMKAGTRCECRSVNHKDHDAVRLVTVAMGPTTHPIKGTVRDYDTQIPMCAACAEYHEAKAAK